MTDRERKREREGTIMRESKKGREGEREHGRARDI